MKILLIDNFDSFTYNLFQLVYQTCQKNNIEVENFKVLRNNDSELLSIKDSDYDLIIISPGPGDPNNTGFCKNVLGDFIGKIPFLGICLGHQLIANYLGANIINAKIPMHGKVSKLDHFSEGIFKDIPNQNKVARYHSLIIDPNSLPKEFIITASTNNAEEIMSIESKKIKLYGLQFHPESFLTEYGDKMIYNFLKSNQNI